MSEVLAQLEKKGGGMSPVHVKKIASEVASCPATVGKYYLVGANGTNFSVGGATIIEAGTTGSTGRLWIVQATASTMWSSGAVAIWYELVNVDEVIIDT